MTQKDVCTHLRVFLSLLCWVFCCSAFTHKRTAVYAGNSLHMCSELIFLYKGADETVCKVLQ